MEACRGLKRLRGAEVIGRTLSLAVKHEYKKPGEGATEPWVFLYLQGLRLLGALWLWRVWYA